MNGASKPSQNGAATEAHGDNMAVWLIGKEKLEMRPFKLPEKLGPREARIRMKAVGICGSDSSYVRTMCCGDYEVKEPMVMGHECAGIIEEVGSEVDHLALGDPVALEPGISCGLCSFCKTGVYNLCPKMKFFATPPIDGCLAEQIIHPADMCFKLPENLTLEEGAMCEPLSVGVHACKRTSVGPDTTVLIIGGGHIGLISMLCVRAFGSPRIVLADVGEQKLALAKKLGVDATVFVSRDEKQDIEKEVKECQEAMGGPIDVTLDCVGLEKSMITSMKATRPGGKICMVGMRGTDMNLPIAAAAAREVDILGVFRYRNTYPLCIQLLSTRKVDVRPLITHHYGFTQEEVVKAFQTGAKDKSAVKVMFNL
ncbi:unnamed protein product [Calypogeia fissa]